VEQHPFPSLVIHAENDLQTLSESDVYARLMAGEIVTIPNCGHFPMEEKPDLFAEVAGVWFEKVG